MDEVHLRNSRQFLDAKLISLRLAKAAGPGRVQRGRADGEGRTANAMLSDLRRQGEAGRAITQSPLGF
jgi:hypothetical protein